jgi:single-strand DNA-binding protein
MLNRIELQCRLCCDPELRQTPSGVSVASFSVACDRDFKSKETGEKETDFIQIVAWRGTGEFAAKHFQKGDMAVIDGRLQMRKYQDRDGNKRIAAEVNAEHIYFGGSKKKEEGETDPLDDLRNNAREQYGAPTYDGFAELNDDPSELPF